MTNKVVVLLNAKHKDGRSGNAYIGKDFKFSTLDINEAAVFGEYEAERFADHNRGWYRGFAGNVTIEIQEAP